MPRKPRQIGNTGFIHVIARGNGRQIIFEGPDDYRLYLHLLKKYSDEENISICAYCLMENHVHLLVHDAVNMISHMMQSLGAAYAGYFNRKYDHTGHVFQGRYLGEPVDNDRYFKIVYRYILNNPKKAGICRAREYPWNSYSLYDNPNTFLDHSKIHELIGGVKELDAFLDNENSDICLEYDGNPDDLAKEKMRNVLGIDNGFLLHNWKREARDQALQVLKQEGLSIRQIERLTGIGRNTIYRA